MQKVKSCVILCIYKSFERLGVFGECNIKEMVVAFLNNSQDSDFDMPSTLEDACYNFYNSSQ